QAGTGSPLMNCTLFRKSTGVLAALASLLLGVSIVTPAQAQAAQGASAAQTTSQRMAAYRERVARLEDHDAVENLQAMFGFYFDKGLWSDASTLFARNGSFEYGQSGVYVGPERIRRAMLLFGPEGLGNGRLNNHMMLQPVITVADDGRTAKGRFQGPVQLSEPGQNGVWGVGIYEHEYVKDGGGWKNSSLHVIPTAFKVDYRGRAS